MPYVAFIIYFMVYQMVEKKLITAQLSDPTFFKFTSSMFKIYQLLFDFILFMGSFYFFYHDFMQIKSLPNNRISLWSWFNALPLVSMLIIISWNMFVEKSPAMTLTFFSITSFLIWLRVVHLLKLFKESAYMLRMGGEILYAMRHLFWFIAISIIAFGFTFYFLSDSESTKYGKTPM
jgi:hypothetical protein